MSKIKVWFSKEGIFTKALLATFGDIERCENKKEAGVIFVNWIEESDPSVGDFDRLQDLLRESTGLVLVCSMKAAHLSHYDTRFRHGERLAWSKPELEPLIKVFGTWLRIQELYSTLAETRKLQGC